MRFIVAADQNWAIGYNGGLLDHLPKDLAFFKEKTTGHVVFMGRKTLETFPKKKPLPNRINIVLTKNRDYEETEGLVLVHSAGELVQELKNYHDDDIFLIGGASMYASLVKYCSEGYVTKIDYAYENADCYFPNLDEMDNWMIAETSEEVVDGDKTIRFLRYINQSPETLEVEDNE